nr:hypothetical protein [Tanacetum cinerariifolium]
LLPLVLEDAFRLEHGRDERQIERYLTQVMERVIAVPFDTWFNVVSTPALQGRIRLQRAGHILGSAYVEVDVEYPLEQR